MYAEELVQAWRMADTHEHDIPLGLPCRVSSPPPSGPEQGLGVWTL